MIDALNLPVAKHQAVLGGNARTLFRLPEITDE